MTLTFRPISLAVLLGLAVPVALASGCGDSKSKGGPSSALTVTSLTPNSGPTEGAVSVRISGTGFAPGSTVTVGGTAIEAAVVNALLITGTMPPHARGSVDVVVTHPHGESATLAGAYRYVDLEILTLEPSSGAPGRTIAIRGSGFLPGLTVTFGGTPATVIGVTPGLVTVECPAHDPGAVEVVVKNPGGQVTIPATFTYDAPPTVRATPTSVAAGGQVTVSWTNPRPVSSLDWIGVFRAGASNLDYLDYKYTDARTSGTVTFIAPSQPGQYEFRYLLDDGYESVAKSEVVTVTAPPSLDFLAARVHQAAANVFARLGGELRVR